MDRNRIYTNEGGTPIAGARERVALMASNIHGNLKESKKGVNVYFGGESALEEAEYIELESRRRAAAEEEREG